MGRKPAYISGFRPIDQGNRPSAVRSDACRGGGDEPAPRGERGRNYSVEIEGSAWTLCGMTIRKLLVASSARARIRSASPS